MADLYGTYDKRIKLTIDNTKIDATLTWIPITVLLTSTAGEEVFVELDADTDFDKCAFTKADETTELYADCEKYDVSGEVAIYHVSLDGWEIASGTDTDFYMYYDDDASPNTSKISKSGGTAGQSVYDANFKAVYHMNDATDTTLPYDTKYEATVEPDADGWTLGGTDYASVSAGILTIDTSADDGYTCYYYKTPDVDFDAGFYLKTKVKASTDMDDVSDALIIQIQDGTQNQQFWMKIRDGEVSYFREPNTTVDIAMDTTTAYVTYEIYIKASTFYIYADGVQKAANTLDTATVTDLVQFGDISVDAGQMCKAEIDYVYYALDIGWNPAITDIVDSTSNNNAGTKKGAGEPAEATGKVGQGQDFDGSDDYILFPCTALSTTDYTIEARFQAETANVNQWAPTHEVVDATTQYDFPRVSALYGSDIIYIQRDASGYYSIPWTADDDWTSVTWIRTSGTISGYIDGASQIVSEGGADFSQDGHDFTGTEFWVSRFHYDGTYYYYTGLLDEYRLSNTARAAAWVKATKESLWDSLLTYGSEETSGVVVDNAIFFGCNF